MRTDQHIVVVGEHGQRFEELALRPRMKKDFRLFEQQKAGLLRAVRPGWPSGLQVYISPQDGERH